MFKFEDQQQLLLQQHNRKDSASSEVAGFLCISGRSSRISSVGSQGSGVSRLSAVSGVSRSPSPHKMLVETSFCGPKPLQDGGESTGSEPATAEILEQVLLSRKHDPTKVVLAEGVNVDTSTPKRKIVPPMMEDGAIGNGGIEKKKPEITHKAPEVRITKPSASGVRSKAQQSSSKKEAAKVVLGVMPSGTEYYRINLKPDHLYNDRGVASNERIIDEGDLQKKPASLNLSRESRKTMSDQRAIQSASPKPARHTALARDTGSRSPSPATLNVSRKSSFCSLFKSKDANASPDSPTVRERSRSRSKSRDNDSQLGTPNKSKSVLAIFKPKRSGSKSKCSSPIDPEGMARLEHQEHSRSVTPTYRPPGKEHLRYYDTPLDGSSIYIPLHTPPEEKDGSRPSTSTSVRVESEPPPPPPPMPPVQYQSASKSPVAPVKGGIRVLPEGPIVLKKTSTTDANKSKRTDNPESNVCVPLRSPSEERAGTETQWSLEVHRHSSQESQETVISSPHITNTENALHKHSQQKPNNANSYGLKNGRPPNAPPAPPTTDPAPTVSNREKRHILFTTKLGSGSEEGLFQTQFSVSKTESVCSQLSEQNSVLSSPTEQGGSIQRSDTVVRREETSPPQPSSSVVLRRKESNAEGKRKINRETAVVDESPMSEPVMSPSKKVLDDPNTRLSRCVDPNEIIEAQKKLQVLRAKKCEAKRLEEERLAKEAEEKERLENEAVIVVEDSKEDSGMREGEAQEASCIESKNLDIPKLTVDQRSQGSTDEPGISSGSEKESDLPSSSQLQDKKQLLRPNRDMEDNESTGLVLQESFDDELPYVPTTLPEERAKGVKLIPIKDRAQIEVKTCPVNRPRSRTPLDPTNLETYTSQADGTTVVDAKGERLKISLPKRTNSSKDRDNKQQRSPRRVSNDSNKAWFEFGGNDEEQMVPTDIRKKSTVTEDPQPPPLPPRKSQPWIDFENIPEKRKPPKKITTLPTKESTPEKGVVYNFVNPEECQCECHETERDTKPSSDSTPGEEAQPLLEVERDAFAGPR